MERSNGIPMEIFRLQVTGTPTDLKGQWGREEGGGGSGCLFFSNIDFFVSRKPADNAKMMN